jgi:hypothetical protein
MEDVTVLE